MINSIFILLILYLGPTIVYLLFSDYRKAILAFYDFVKHREIKFFLLSLSKFLINVGASAASLVIIAYFVPQSGVTTIMLFKVGISGIITSISGYYIERFLK